MCACTCTHVRTLLYLCVCVCFMTSVVFKGRTYVHYCINVCMCVCVCFMTSSGVSRIVLKRGQNRDFGEKEGSKKNEKN